MVMPDSCGQRSLALAARRWRSEVLVDSSGLAIWSSCRICLAAPWGACLPVLDELAAQILAFEQHYNAAARPFGWKFTRTDLNRLLARNRQHDRHAPHPPAA
jgi:hypothetical protein